MTDGERRELAARLRGPFDVVGQGRYVALNGTLFGMQLLANSEGELRGGLLRLADLIEPGGNECAPGECPVNTRRDNDGIDRAALLALAEELERMAFADGGADGDEPVMSRGGCACFARRIREACGAKEEG